MTETYVNGLFGPQKCRTQPNDIYYTPEKLAKAIINYYKPNGNILEPCKGAGAFLKHLPEGSQYCEISEGINFFEFTNKMDWICRPKQNKRNSKLANRRITTQRNKCAW